MEYEVALSRSWQELESLAQEKVLSIRLLDGSYTVDLEKKTVFSLSCNVPCKAYTAILILHHVSKKIKGLSSLTGEWISFRELSGGEGYYPTFKKRVLDVIVRKYGKTPENLFGLVKHQSAKKAQLADASVCMDTFETSAPVLITLWRGDEEFGPEANLLYDRSIKDIFCTEDIVVLSELVAHSI